MAGLDFKDILTAEQVEEIKALAKDDLEDPAVRISIYDAISPPTHPPLPPLAVDAKAIINALTSVKQKLDEIANNSGYANTSTEYTQFVNSLYIETRDKALLTIGKTVTESIEGKIKKFKELEAKINKLNSNITAKQLLLQDRTIMFNNASPQKDDSVRSNLLNQINNLTNEITSLELDKAAAEHDLNSIKNDILGPTPTSSTGHSSARDVEHHGNQLVKTLKRHLAVLDAPIPYELAPDANTPDEIVLWGPPVRGLTKVKLHPFSQMFDRFTKTILEKDPTTLTEIEEAFLVQAQTNARNGLFDTTTTRHAWIALSHSGGVSGITGADAAQNLAKRLVDNAFSPSPPRFLAPAASVPPTGVTPASNFTNNTTHTLVYPSATTLRLYAQANGIDARVPNAAFKQALIARLGTDILGEVPEAETVNPEESANILERIETAYAEKRANYHTRRFLPTTLLKNAFGDKKYLKWIGFGETSDKELAKAREDLRKSRLIHARNTIAAKFSDEKYDIIGNPAAKAQLINEVMAFTLDSRDRVISKERENRSKNITWHERLENLINKNPLLAIGIAAGAVGVGALGVAVAGPAAAPWIAGVAGVTAGIIKTKLGSRWLQAGIGKIGFWGLKSSAEDYHGAPLASGGFDVTSETSDVAHKKLGQAIAVFSTAEHRRRYTGGAKWLDNMLLWRGDAVKTQGKKEVDLFEPTLFKQELNNHLKQYMKAAGGTSVSGVAYPFKAPVAEQKAAIINELIAFAIEKREAEIEQRVEKHKEQLARIGAASDVISALALGVWGGATAKELAEGGGTLLAKGWHSFWDSAANWWNGTPVETASDKVANAIDAGKEAATPKASNSDGVIDWVKSKVKSITETVTGEEATTASPGDFTFTIPTGPETPGITQILEKSLNLNADQISDLHQYFGQIKDMNGMADINKIYDGDELTLPQKMVEHMAKMKGISAEEVREKITAFAAK